MDKVQEIQIQSRFAHERELVKIVCPSGRKNFIYSQVEKMSIYGGLNYHHKYCVKQAN